MPAVLPQSVAAQVDAVGRAFLRQRPLVVLPLLVWTISVLRLHDVGGAQTAALAGGMSVGLALFCVEAWFAWRRPISRRWLFTSLLLTTFALSGVSTLTGGVSGPFLSMLFAPVGVGFAAFGRSARSATLAGAALLAVLLLVALPPGVPFALLPAGAHRLVAAGAMVAATALLWLGVGGLADAYVAASSQALAASEEVVAAAHARVRAVEVLSGHFAHALKNPLAALRALLEVMAEGPAAERDAKRLEVARGEVERMEDIVVRGLDFSTPLSPAARAPVHLEQLIARVAAVVEPLAARAGVTIKAHGAPVEVRVDAEPLREAILNLTLNALEATPAGGTITLRWSAHALEVEDTGRGMSPETLARVGTPFFSTREAGTGLGVALVHQVAAQHGGRLTLESDPERGTVARLEFGP